MTSLPGCKTLLLDRSGGRLTITLNRPETKNALDAVMVAELSSVVDFLDSARDIACVLLRGAGGSFCAGGDIKGFMAQFSTPSPAPGERDPIAVNNRRFGTFLSRFDGLPQTIVIAVEGAAFGGGLGLAAIGDVVLAMADARFAMSETGLGIIPAQIFFDGVRVPQRYRICEEGLGLIYQMEQFQEERLWAAAGGLIGMERTIQSTIDYTRSRIAFGQSILDNQVVHFRLAELQTKVELLRSLVYRAVEEYLGGADVTNLASMAKLTVGRLQREVADSCLQYWGGMGYMSESAISRVFRDSRLGSIGGGADEIMLGIICKQMGTLPGKKRPGSNE